LPLPKKKYLKGGGGRGKVKKKNRKKTPTGSLLDSKKLTEPLAREKGGFFFWANEL